MYILKPNKHRKTHLFRLSSYKTKTRNGCRTIFYCNYLLHLVSLSKLGVKTNAKTRFQCIEVALTLSCKITLWSRLKTVALFIRPMATWSHNLYKPLSVFPVNMATQTKCSLKIVWTKQLIDWNAVLQKQYWM